jgi:hypothetical protein
MIGRNSWQRLRNPVTAALAVAGLLGVAAGPGCVFRKEAIRVSADGSVTIDLEIEGSEQELSSGDAMPSERSGWSVAYQTKKDGDEETQVLQSRRVFEPREALPRSFAEKDDAATALYLDFPTTVQMEQRADGLYCVFRRSYTPRRWAYVQYWQEQLFDDNIKKLAEKPVENLSRDEKLQIVQAFSGFEAYKQLTFAEEALRKASADVPVEAGLAARRALLDVYEEDNEYFGSVLDRCEPLSQDEQSDCFVRESERILQDGHAAYVDSLRNQSKLTDEQFDRISRAFDWEKRYYEITDQLGGHGFEIDVYMPGEIVAHNADKAELDDRGEGYVRFQFDGKALRDRTHELIVVSRVDEHGRQGRGGR